MLVGFETLKTGYGWSDEEAYDHFCFDVQVRYALGYRDLSEGHFELRTAYNFRQRVAQHMQETDENLIGRAFEQVTDDQIAAFELKTNNLRMDSTPSSPATFARRPAYNCPVHLLHQEREICRASAACWRVNAQAGGRATSQVCR